MTTASIHLYTLAPVFDLQEKVLHSVVLVFQFGAKVRQPVYLNKDQNVNDNQVVGSGTMLGLLLDCHDRID